MKLASFEWRTAALPAVVLTVAASAFLWFNYVRRPAVEQYLHQANLRLLRTMGAQLESRIDGIEGNIDLALQAVRQTKAGGGSFDQKRFASFVRMYAADLVINCLAPATDTSEQSSCSGAAETVLKEAGKPPVARWQRGSGRARLYLGYRSDDSSVVANIDLQTLFADNLPAEPEFSAILLADSAGRVIVQHSAEGLSLPSISRLPIDDGSAEPSEGKGQDAERGFARLQDARPNTGMVGGRSYHFYVQPLSLSVKLLESQGVNGREEWTLCGLVADDRIRAASSAVSYDTLIWFAAIFIAVGASVPLLKLGMLRSHERLTRVDAALVSASIFVEVALVSFVALDFLQFGVIVPRLVEDELTGVAKSVIEEFTSEAKQIDAQMDDYHLQLQRGLAGKRAGITPKINVAESVTCAPDWACRAALKEEPPRYIEQMPYPFFDLVNWIDRAGNQHVKLASAASVTPFINLNDQRVAWAESLSEALRLGPDVSQSGVSVLLSPTTGKRLTIFWKARPQTPTGDAFTQLVGQSLATNPLSLDQPVLPADISLAVVDRKGLVLFHSDRTRSMKENFIQESEDNLRLRTLVEHGRDGVLKVNYRARDQFLLVRPLTSALPRESASAAKFPFEPPDWSLIVFQEHSVPDTLNLYTLAMAGFLFVGYSSVLVLTCGVATLLFRKRALAWLWPDRRQTLAYWAVAAVNGSVALICVIGIYGLTPPRALALTGAGVVLALGTSVFVPAWSKPRRANEKRRDKGDLCSRWLPAFVAAQSSLILTLAVIPAMAAMHTAVTIEQSMFMVRDAQQRLDGNRARFQRLQARIPVKGLCSGSEDTPECDLKVAAYVSRLRTANERSVIASPLFPDQDTSSVGAMTAGAAKTSTWLLPQMEWFLRHAHPPMNDLGVGLAAFVSETAPRGAQPSVWWLLVLPGVGLLAVWLVRDVTDRLCLPALNAPGPVPGKIAIKPVNRLFLTLPGADTTREWRRLKARHVDGRLQPLTWPGNETPMAVVVVHHLQVVLADRAARERLLSQLEAAVYQEGQPVWLICDREPVRYLVATLPEGARGDSIAQAGRNEVNRWIALLQSFPCEIWNAGTPPRRLAAPSVASDPLAQAAAGCAALEPLTKDIRQRLVEPDFTDADRLRVFEEAAEPYYRSLWTSCSIEERLVLRQLAEEGLVNPRDRDVLQSLMRKRLVVRDPAFRLMNESFSRFVKRAVPARTISEWERQVAGTPWSSVRTAVLTFALAGAGFVVFTQQQIVSAWVGLLPALAPALLIPMAREAVGKLLAQGLTSKAENV